ncbi:E3 ubiquitin-protein ligase PUB22 [Sesamum angolense]|uniref:U-box domain-containing protein n=1 Tax=Sesamum angolense TaxID=2727404 RepID=A0AAE2BSW9_9LAMI|nr:E3 ubiquitin-protein ligase PUB22 [Sesamum angolense]
MADEIEVPPYFLCPIALDIMKDPVTISTGITYDRDSIERWIFSQKNNTCPVTKQVLYDTELTPNITLRRLIQSWCTLHAAQGIQRLPTPKAPVSKPQLLKLLNDAKTPQLQFECLKRLRSIASQNQTNRRCMETSGTAEFLASLIVQKTLQASRDEVSEESLSELRKACEEALSILYSLQLSESSLKSLTNNEFVESLTRVMQSRSYESRAYAVLLLKSMLEAADPAQVLIKLQPQFFVELAQILNDQICQKASKATLKLLISVCPWGRNRIKAVEAGAVPILIDLLLESSDKRACEMTLTVLDLLCQCAEGRAELLKHGAGLAIVSKKILRVSQVASERAVRILHSVSKFSATPAVLQEMLQIGVVAKLGLVLQVDCGSRTKERAREMLKSYARAWRNSPCLPNSLISSYPA